VKPAISVLRIVELATLYVTLYVILCFVCHLSTEISEVLYFVGGMEAICDLLQVDNVMNQRGSDDPLDITMRRYLCMTLTNLTYGECANKALFCSLQGAPEALVALLTSGNEELTQVH